MERKPGLDAYNNLLDGKSVLRVEAEKAFGGSAKGDLKAFEAQGRLVEEKLPTGDREIRLIIKK